MKIPSSALISLFLLAFFQDGAKAQPLSSDERRCADLILRENCGMVSVMSRTKVRPRVAYWRDDWGPAGALDPDRYRIRTYGDVTDEFLHLSGSGINGHCYVQRGPCADLIERAVRSGVTSLNDGPDGSGDPAWPVRFDDESGNPRPVSEHPLYRNPSVVLNDRGEEEEEVTFTESGMVVPPECTEIFPGMMATGDPHFRTWQGVWFDFHYGCDIVLVDAPDFGNGIGLTIHIRTTVRHDYSFISTAAVLIGTDVLEVTGYGNYVLNGVNSADSVSNNTATMGNGKYGIEYDMINKREHHFVVRANQHETLRIRTHKDIVSVKIETADSRDFKSSKGIMGDYTTGALMTRNGDSFVVEEGEHQDQQQLNRLGMEWQVQPDEPMLFQDARFPQAPQACVAPEWTEESRGRRRLLEEDGGVLSHAEAEKACENLARTNERKMCIVDVLATGDVGLAGAF